MKKIIENEDHQENEELHDNQKTIKKILEHE